MEPLARPRVLLLGDPAARPPGLERALTRGGFQLVEREDPSIDPDADAILITVSDIDQGPLAHLLPAPAPGSPGFPPRVVIVATTDRDAPAAALSLGASDVLAAPIYLPELCARLHAQIKARPNPASAPQQGQLLDFGQANGRQPCEPLEDLSDSEAAQAALDLRMQQEFERARRYSLSFSLILLGVDELRGIRERLGSEAADKLKADVACALRRELRLPDGRTGYPPVRDSPLGRRVARTWSASRRARGSRR